MLLPFVGRTDDERRVMLNTRRAALGRQPGLVHHRRRCDVRRVAARLREPRSPGFYVALILTLFALFFRPVGFDYRSKVRDPRWRNAWDWGIFVGGTVPALVFGVAFGNLLHGVPFQFDADLRVIYTGSFFELLNPFGLVAGLVSVAMLTMHGAIYLQLRTEGAVQTRALRSPHASPARPPRALRRRGILGRIRASTATAIVSMPPPNTSFVAARQDRRSARPGGWLANYTPSLDAHGRRSRPLPWAARRSRSSLRRAAVRFWRSCCRALAVAGVVLTAGFALFPFVMPSSSDPRSSLTIWDSVSSHRTLQVMFWAVLIFLPLIILYTSWVYGVMRGKVTERHIREGGSSLY